MLQDSFRVARTPNSVSQDGWHFFWPDNREWIVPARKGADRDRRLATSGRFGQDVGRHLLVDKCLHFRVARFLGGNGTRYRCPPTTCRLGKLGKLKWQSKE